MLLTEQRLDRETTGYRVAHAMQSLRNARQTLSLPDSIIDINLNITARRARAPCLALLDNTAHYA